MHLTLFRSVCSHSVRWLGVTLCLGAALQAVLLSEAQVCKAPDVTHFISTDRPSFTNSSTTVPCRTLQFENGFNETAFQGERGWDLPETLVRFGATTRTELRFTAPEYDWNTESAGSFANGASDLSVGVKQQLGPVHGFDVAAIATLSLPSGSARTSSHGYDATIELPWSHQLPAKLTAEGMFSVAWPTQNGQHNVTGLVTGVFDRQLTKSWDGFAEYAGTFPGQGGPEHVVDFGTTYKVTRNQQVDVRGGLCLSSAAVNHFIGAGYSFRFNLYRAQ